MLLLRLVIGALSLFPVISVNFDFLPSITKFSYQFSDKLGDPNKSKNLELSCYVSGEPKPEVEFQFNNVRLSSSLRVRQIDSNKIKISNVNHTTDEGKYRCIARNKNGRAFKERFIQIQRLGYFLPRYTAKDNVIYRDVTLGRPLILPCPDHISSHPVKYFWGRTGPPPSYLTEDKRINVLDTGTLHISNLQQEDVDRFNGLGGISCVMVSEGQVVESAKVVLRVSSEVRLPAHPRVSPKLPSVTNIEDGASTSIRCPATGKTRAVFFENSYDEVHLTFHSSPAPDITWYKDGIRINTSNSHVDISQTSELSITDFNKSLQGHYMCSLNNSEGNDNSTTTLRLVEPPTVVTRMSSHECIKQNSKLLLNCEAKGTERINYEWYHNGTLLESYSTTNSKITVSGSVLSIEPLHFNDTGIYHCFAYNDYGDASDGSIITVTETNKPNCACTNSAVPASITTKCAYSSSIVLHAYYLIIVTCHIAVLMFYDLNV